MAPMRRRASAWTPSAASSKRRMFPAVGFMRPRSIPIVVVLPEPFGPSSPNTPPPGTFSDRLSTAVMAP